MKKRAGSEGNALFLILIAVALFAGLTYVISHSTRSGSGNTDQEWIKMVQAQIDNVTLAVSSTLLRKQFKSECDLTDMLDNFCPPTTAAATCAAMPNPACNIVSENDSERPALNWIRGTGAPLIRLSGADQTNNVRLSLWGGTALSTDINLVLAAFEIEDSPTYMNYAKWAGLCTAMNKKNGLPTPDVIAAMAAGTKNAFYVSNGMNSAVCELDAGATPDKIRISYPIAQQGYN